MLSKQKGPKFGLSIAQTQVRKREKLSNYKAVQILRCKLSKAVTHFEVYLLQEFK
jgi:hypothetical protein